LDLQVLLPLANGSEDMEAITIIDALRRANASVVVASVEDGVEITARYGTRIVADVMLDDAAHQAPFDLIIVPASTTWHAKNFTETRSIDHRLIDRHLCFLDSSNRAACRVRRRWVDVGSWSPC
jgi:putative intracellular protease/amidase